MLDAFAQRVEPAVQRGQDVRVLRPVVGLYGPQGGGEFTPPPVARGIHRPRVAGRGFGVAQCALHLLGDAARTAAQQAGVAHVQWPSACGPRQRTGLEPVGQGFEVAAISGGEGPGEVDGELGVGALRPGGGEVSAAVAESGQPSGFERGHHARHVVAVREQASGGE